MASPVPTYGRRRVLTATAGSGLGLSSLVLPWAASASSALSTPAPSTGAGGSLDSAFDPGPDNNVFALDLQSDGRILVGGAFTSVDGSTSNRIARLAVDGSLDTAFATGADGIVYAVASQSDGKIIIGGRSPTRVGRPGTASPVSTPTERWTPGSMRTRTRSSWPWRSRMTDGSSSEARSRPSTGRRRGTWPACPDCRVSRGRPG